MIRESIRQNLLQTGLSSRVLSSMRFFQVRWCGQEKTAAIVSGRTFEEVHPDARIQEMDFGVDEGKPYSMIRDLFDVPEAYVPPERAESIQMRSRNVSRSFWTCCRIFQNKINEVHTVLAASHGAALRGIMSCIDHCELKDFWRSGCLIAVSTKLIWRTESGWKMVYCIR